MWCCWRKCVTGVVIEGLKTQARLSLFTSLSLCFSVFSFLFVFAWGPRVSSVHLHAAIPYNMTMDLIFESVSKSRIKCFISWALVMVSGHSSRTVTKTVSKARQRWMFERLCVVRTWKWGQKTEALSSGDS